MLGGHSSPKSRAGSASRSWRRIWRTLRPCRPGEVRAACWASPLWSTGSRGRPDPPAFTATTTWRRQRVSAGARGCPRLPSWDDAPDQPDEPHGPGGFEAPSQRVSRSPICTSRRRLTGRSWPAPLIRCLRERRSRAAWCACHGRSPARSAHRAGGYLSAATATRAERDGEEHVARCRQRLGCLLRPDSGLALELGPTSTPGRSCRGSIRPIGTRVDMCSGRGVRSLLRRGAVRVH
jgi:hypothetical protein